MIADLFDRLRCRDQLTLCVGIDAQEAGPHDSGRSDAQVNFGSSGVAQHLHELLGRATTYDRIVHHDGAAIAYSVMKRIQLDTNALFAQLLGGFDERAIDIAVLDQSL